MKRVAFEAAVDTYIVEALGDPVASIKEYILSRSGSPLALRVPMPLPKLRFDSRVQVDSIPQSWAAGEPYLNLRAIPLQAADSSLDVNGTASAGYTFTSQIAVDVNGVTGGILFELTPTISYMYGGRITKAFLPESTSGRWIGGLDYRVGWRFGSSGGRSAVVSGTAAFRDVRGARSQLTIALRQALSALGAPGT